MTKVMKRLALETFAGVLSKGASRRRDEASRKQTRFLVDGEGKENFREKADQKNGGQVISRSSGTGLAKYTALPSNTISALIKGEKGVEGRRKSLGAWGSVLRKVEEILSREDWCRAAFVPEA